MTNKVKITNPSVYTGSQKYYICMPDTYILFDLETTGLFPRKSDPDYETRIHPEILELSAIKVENNVIVDKFDTMVRPHQETIPEEAQKVNNITMEMLENAPYPEEVLPMFMAFCEGYLLTGYNSMYDIRVLRCNLTRYCRDIEPNIHYFDCYNLFKGGLMPSDYRLRYSDMKLCSVADYYGVVNPAPHRAMGDVLTTYEVYKCMQCNVTGFYTMAANYRGAGEILTDTAWHTFTQTVQRQSKTGLNGKRVHTLITPSTFIMVENFRTGEHTRDGAEIYALAAYKVHNWEIVDTFNILLKPKNEYNATELFKYNNMSKSILDTYGVTQEDGLAMFKEWSQGYLLIGYAMTTLAKMLQVYYNNYLHAEDFEIYYLDMRQVVKPVLSGKVNAASYKEVLKFLGLPSRTLKDLEKRLEAAYEIYCEMYRRYPDLCTKCRGYYGQWDTYYIPDDNGQGLPIYL